MINNLGYDEPKYVTNNNCNVDFEFIAVWNVYSYTSIVD